MASNHRYVVTGGPGAGKSTLIDALAAAGHRGFPEAGRSITRAQRTIGGGAGHDGDRRLYAELMLSWDIRSHGEAATADGPAFFDRGVPEMIGYMRLVGESVPAHFVEAARLFRYAEPVFVAPAWQAIFANDAERAQDFAEAVATEQAVRSAYAECGYRLVDLPKASVAERAAFVLWHVPHATA